MNQFSKTELNKKAKELGFVRDTFEKVCRLADILSFIESDSLLSNSLALKGGTAINLTILDLPRLSVDIDLDYSKDVLREDMLAEREKISERIQKYMAGSGYVLSLKSKYHHALDSFVFEYMNAGGVKDNLKIEINYMLRCHVLPLSRRSVNLPWDKQELTILSVDPLEIFATKTAALINRSAPRDLYDIFNMQNHKIFEEKEERLLRKCVMFYIALTSESVPKDFNLDGIDKISEYKIKTNLIPVLRQKERFDLYVVQKQVKDWLSKILVPTDKELSFWEAFSENKFQPELLFDDAEILSRIKNHPMALWKCGKVN